MADAGCEGEHRCHICGRAGPEGAGNFNGSCTLARFATGDAVGATLVAPTFPCGPFGGIERSASRALPSLLPKLWVPDVNGSHEPHELQAVLISDKRVMRQFGVQGRLSRHALAQASHVPRR